MQLMKQRKIMVLIDQFYHGMQDVSEISGGHENMKIYNSH